MSAVAVDCRFQPAPGVNIHLSSTNPQTQGVSTTFMPTSTTDQTGIVLFANVPTGPLTLTATPIALGRPSSQVNVVVQAGITTVVQMFPDANNPLNALGPSGDLHVNGVSPGTPCIEA